MTPSESPIQGLDHALRTIRQCKHYPSYIDPDNSCSIYSAIGLTERDWDDDWKGCWERIERLVLTKLAILDARPIGVQVGDFIEAEYEEEAEYLYHCLYVTAIRPIRVYRSYWPIPYSLDLRQQGSHCETAAWMVEFAWGKCSISGEPRDGADGAGSSASLRTSGVVD